MLNPVTFSGSGSSCLEWCRCSGFKDALLANENHELRDYDDNKVAHNSDYYSCCWRWFFFHKRGWCENYNYETLDGLWPQHIFQIIELVRQYRHWPPCYLTCAKYQATWNFVTYPQVSPFFSCFYGHRSSACGRAGFSVGSDRKLQCERFCITQPSNCLHMIATLTHSFFFSSSSMTTQSCVI